VSKFPVLTRKVKARNDGVKKSNRRLKNQILGTVSEDREEPTYGKLQHLIQVWVQPGGLLVENGCIFIFNIHIRN
jgi:hypothetical protein